nr:MAG TPA: tailspike protein [Caudoviricetes sp.]
MTVQKDVTKNIYVGNGSTRTFPFTFECPAEHSEYIKVYLMQDDGTALATSDYQLDMDAKQITYPSSGTALPEGKKLVIMRELPLQQMMNLVNNGPYFAEDIETAFDECVMAMQQIAEKLNRSIIMSVDIDGDAFVNEVPFEAGKSFRIADDGKSIVLTEDPAKVLPLVQGVYAQAQAQAQSAAVSATAAAKSENSAAASANAATNSAQSASTSAASAAENARLSEGYKTAAETAKTDASLYATNAKTSADTASASKETAQSAATTASNFATDARSSAGEAKTYKDNAKTYMDNAKNYSENVNVFVPSVSSDGVLSWTNKAGLTNPTSVNIKGAKGDTGTAASIKIGSVITGAAGSNASVTNSGTASNVVLNFTLPRGKDGKDGGVTVDAELSDTSTNPIQNKAVKEAIYAVTTAIPTKVSALENDAGYLTQHQSLAGYTKTSVANTWTAQQNFHDLMLNREKYTTYVVNSTSDTPIISTMVYAVTGAFTLNLATLAGVLSASQSSVFTAYFAASADYALTITNAGTLKYVGSASDVAITSAGLLLNVWMSKDGAGTLTSIVQASKLS